MNSIITEEKNKVGIIKLNRPQAFNSVNKTLALEFQKQLKAFAENDNVRCILITGEGKAFCAGQDIVEITDPSLNPGLKNILEEHYAPIIRLIRSIEKPVVAGVNGVAAGAGANIALACDIVIATEEASFMQAFSAIGLIPDSGGTFFLPRLVGFQKAMALSMLAEKVSAPDAESMGMIYKYYPKEEFAQKITEVSEKLANMPTAALALTKKAFNQSMANDLEAQLLVENDYQIQASETEDYQEGVTAFIEKRRPNFKGK